MTNVRDSDALSAYLHDLHNQVRASSPALSTVIRVLAEPLSFLGFLPAQQHQSPSTNATLESLPSWAGPVEPTGARRLYFIQNLLPNHLEFILDNITIDWLSALPSAEQTALFDTYFVPALVRRSTAGKGSSYDPAIAAAMATVSLQTLIGRINQRFSENHSFLNKTILRLLKKLLEEYTLLDYFKACYQIGSTAEYSQQPSTSAIQTTKWDTFLSKLFSVPTRVSNALGASRQFSSSSTVDRAANIEQWFQEAFFFEQQAAQLQGCVITLSDVNKQYAQAFGVVIAKLLRLGFGGTLVKSVVSALWDKDSSAETVGWRLALAASTPTTAQTFLSALTGYLNANQLESSRLYTSTAKSTNGSRQEVHKAAHLLVSLGYGGGEDNNDIVGEILFQGRVYGSGVLRALICIQSGWPTGVKSGKDSALAHTFMRAMTIWSDTMLVNHASMEYQKYISYQLLLMIGYFNTSTLLELDAIPIFGTGVGNWLELEVFKRKQIGLIVAEEFSKAVDTIGSPADFGLNGADPDVKFARSLVTLRDGAHSYQPQPQSQATLGIAKSSEDQGAHTVYGFDTTRNRTQVSDLADSDDDEDPDAVADSFPCSHRHLSDNESSDDDDDLKPYEMEDESDPDEEIGATRKPKVAPPLYLRDLITFIRADEDREKTEIGLQTAAELIRRKVGSLELEEHAEDLANAFVQLQDTFDTPSFYKLREGALVALVVASPMIVSGVLTFQFYEKKNSLGQRLNILTALAIGAQELSGFDQSTLPLSKEQSASTNKAGRPAASAAATGSTSLAKTLRPTFDNITSTISLDRTRRFSQKSNIEANRPAPKANAFANLAPAFLGGLLGRWGGNRGAGAERGYDALQRAPIMVLKKFVVTLGVLVHYSGNSPHLLPMTRELFQFLLALRYHTPPSQPSPGSFGGAKSRPSPSLDSLSSMLSGATLATPTITSLKLPGDPGSSSTMTSSPSTLPGAPFNADLVESLLFDLLILVTPASGALSDDLLLHEFYVEILETQQWAMELWESQKLEQGSGSHDKARMYCAALLQRCFELMKVSM